MNFPSSSLSFTPKNKARNIRLDLFLITAFPTFLLATKATFFSGFLR